MKLSSLGLIYVLLASAAPALFAAVIGTNPPCPPLSAERIAALPPADQAAWRDYLARSAAALAADKKFYADELTALGLTAPLVPAKASGRVIPIKPPGDSFASVEARRLADHLVSFQTPAGGWNKNTDFGKAPRRPGERSGSEAGYVGTIDNAATVFPLYFLAAVINAASPNPVHRAAFNRGSTTSSSPNSPPAAGLKSIRSKAAITMRSRSTTAPRSTSSPSSAPVPPARATSPSSLLRPAPGPPPPSSADSPASSPLRSLPPTAAAPSGANNTTRSPSSPSRRAPTKCRHNPPVRARALSAI